jgi:hypothetical protein
VAKLRSLLSDLCRMTVKPEVILRCREKANARSQPARPGLVGSSRMVDYPNIIPIFETCKPPTKNCSRFVRHPAVRGLSGLHDQFAPLGLLQMLPLRCGVSSKSHEP